MIAVQFAAPEGATTEQEQLLAAVSGSLTTFLSAAFVAWTGDKDSSPVANRIRDAFQEHYVRAGQDAGRVQPIVRLEKDSALEKWVHSYDHEGVHGWDFEARWKRARKVAELMRS